MTEPCEDCGGRGWDLFEEHGLTCGHNKLFVIESCDTCRKYPGDVAAGIAAYAWILEVRRKEGELEEHSPAADVALRARNLMRVVSGRLMKNFLVAMAKMPVGAQQELVDFLREMQRRLRL